MGGMGFIHERLLMMMMMKIVSYNNTIQCRYITIILIIIEGLSLLQSIPPTTANKQTQAQKKRGSMARKLLGANAKSFRLKLN